MTASNSVGQGPPATLVLTVSSGGGGGGGGTVAQAITFSAIVNKTFGDAPFAVAATASSGLPVSFVVTSGLGTIYGNLLTLTGVGPVIVRASQGGNSTYQPAPTVDRSFNVVNPAGTTLGTNGSIWHDVSGDGLRDEIIKANTNRFTVRITAMDEPVEIQINSNWTWGILYNSDDTYGPGVYPNHRWTWLPWMNTDPPAVAEFDFEYEPGWEYVVFGETILPTTGRGRYGDDVANWPQSHIASVLDRHPNNDDELAGSRLIVRELNLLNSWLNCSYYVIKLGYAPGGCVINLPTGPTTILRNNPNRIPVNLPEVGNVVAQVQNSAGKILDGLGQRIAWRVKPTHQSGTPAWNPSASMDLATLPPGDYDIHVKVDDDDDTHPQDWLFIQITIQRLPRAEVRLFRWDGVAYDPANAEIFSNDDDDNQNRVPDRLEKDTFDNDLRRLELAWNKSIQAGTLTLKISPYLRIWKGTTRQTAVLDGMTNVVERSWELSNAGHRAELEEFTTQTIWLEGLRNPNGASPGIENITLTQSAYNLSHSTAYSLKLYRTINDTRTVGKSPGAATADIVGFMQASAGAVRDHHGPADVACPFNFSYNTVVQDAGGSWEQVSTASWGFFRSYMNDRGFQAYVLSTINGGAAVGMADQPGTVLAVIKVPGDNTYAHEVGHNRGLGHVVDSTNLMNSPHGAGDHVTSAQATQLGRP